MRIVLAMILFATLTAYADDATQTDWSGGDGVIGPVYLNWDNTFSFCSGIQYSTPSILTISLGLEHVISEQNEYCSSVQAVDLDNDDDVDMVGGLGDSSGVVWWENADGSGSSWIEHVIDGDYENPTALRVDDIDGDGDPDVIAVNNLLSTSTLMWWENADGTGSTWVPHDIDGISDGARCLYVRDIDGDNDIDVVSSIYWNGVHIWWENADGIGSSWIQHIIGYSGQVVSIFSEDLDGDGDSDVLTSSDGSLGILWWENVDGQGTNWIWHCITSMFMAMDIKACDMDADGDADVIKACSGNGTIWWENYFGTGTSWIEHEIGSDPQEGLSVETGDLDDDGDIDVLGTTWMENGGVTWWENLDGSSLVWQKHTLCIDLEWPVSACVADFDNDGINDAACSSIGSVNWWDLNAYKSQGYLESTILDTACATEWVFFTWNSILLPGTSVAFQLRASYDYLNMGLWSDTLTAPCAIDTILNIDDRFVQYRAILSTEDPLMTPLLEDLTITWVYMGIEEETGPVPVNVLSRISPNPTIGSVVIDFGLSKASYVELLIFDLSGRLVSMIDGEEYSAGYHDVLLGELSPGVYFCRMTSGDFEAVQHFVVIE